MKSMFSLSYVHVSALDELLSEVTSERQDDILYCCDRIGYEVIKLNKYLNTLSLIHTDGWDSRYEPIVVSSDVFDISKSGKPKFVRTIICNNRVYHRKHDFVKEDYEGFDVEESRRRTAKLSEISEVQESKSKIGNRKFWENLLEKYNLPIYMP